MSKDKLTIKQENFCNKYVECGNASEAYRFAFSCKKATNRTITVKASHLLSRDNIGTRVKELQEELKAKSDITKERVIAELGAILNSKITDYLSFDGKTVTFKPFSELTEIQIKVIESIKEGKTGIELKLHGKSWTIERICKMLGFYNPTEHEITGEKESIQITIVDKLEENEDLSKLSVEELITLRELNRKMRVDND